MVIIRQATEEDYSKIVEFHNNYYTSKRTIEQFYWEFHNCPFGPSIYYIAEDNNKIIATNCLIPIEVVNGKGEVLISAKSEDSLLDPDYWGQPIFYNLYIDLLKKAEEKGISSVWGFTPARKPFKKLGFTLPFKHSQSLMVNNILSSYSYLAGLNTNNRIGAKLKILGLCFYSKMKRFRVGESISSGNYSISREDTTFGIKELIHLNLQKHPNLFSIHQTPEYINWRIYENPNFFKTHTIAFRNLEKKLLGVITYNSHPNNIAYICNCIFHPELSRNEIQTMIRYSALEVFKEGVELIRNWHFNHNPINLSESQDFQKAGFTLLDRGIDFVWKEIKPSGLKPTNFLLSRMATQGVI